MRSCKNATGGAAGGATVQPQPDVTTRGVLRPAQTAETANLHRDHPVAEPLRPFVERYWSVRWDLTGRPAFRAEVLSHPSVNVSVEEGSHPRFGFALPAVLLHPVATRRFSVDLVGWGRVTAVKFRPGGYTALTGSPPPRGRVTRLGDGLATAPSDLLAAVLAQEDDDARAAALDAAFLPLGREPSSQYLSLLALLQRMAGDRGLVRVDDVAALAGTTVRSLQRLFAGYVGVGPKAVLARYRLHDAVATIDAGGVTDLAALAAQLGWYDQAHFTRDFRDVVGTTPAAYARRAVSAPSA